MPRAERATGPSVWVLAALDSLPGDWPGQGMSVRVPVDSGPVCRNRVPGPSLRSQSETSHAVSGEK